MRSMKPHHSGSEKKQSRNVSVIRYSKLDAIELCGIVATAYKDADIVLAHEKPALRTGEVS